MGSVRRVSLAGVMVKRVGEGSSETLKITDDQHGLG